VPRLPDHSKTCFSDHDPTRCGAWEGSRVPGSPRTAILAGHQPVTTPLGTAQAVGRAR